jgi:hypothetical protein
MTQQTIDVGAAANDGTGEPLRNAFTAVNDNFTQIWTAGPVGSQVRISGNIITTTVTNLGLTLAGNGIGNIQANSTIVPGTAGVYDLGAPDRTFQYIYGDYLVGNGALLTGIVATSSYNNANVAAFLPTYTGNLVSLTGPVRTTANVIAGNIITSGFLGVSGNISGGNITGNNLISSGSISAVGNITTAGNIAGNYLLGNGAFITGITATNISAAALTGTTLSSNVLYSSLKVVDDLLYLDVVGNITTQGRFVGSGAGLTNIPGANIVGSVANATYAVTAATAYSIAGANVTGAVANATYAVSAGSATTANTATTATYATTANAVAGANVSGTVANATYAVTAGSATTANTATVAGTVTTAAQPNITSVGTLTSVSVSGNATAGNILTSGKISAVGNITGNYFIGNGALLTGVAASNVNANALTGTTLSSNVLYSSLKVVDDLLYLDVVGNITTQGRFIGSGSGLTNISGANITGTVANATYAVTAGTAYSVAGANVTGAVANATYATSAGVATTANTATIATYATTANAVAGANVAGVVANATYATSAGVATTANIAATSGTVTTAAQPNITSIGTLTSVTVAGNATAGNISTSGKISAVGNITGNYFVGNGSQLTGVSASNGNANALVGTTLSSNVIYSSLKVVDDLLYLDVVGNVTGNYFIGNGSLLTGIVATGVGVLTNLSVTGNTQTGNLLTGGKVSATGNVAGNYFIGNGSQLTGIIASAGAAITNGNSNVTVNANGNVTVGAVGTSNVTVFAPTGAYVAGVVSATGNIAGNYLLGNGALITGLPAGYSNTDVANFLPTYTGNLVSLTGPVTTTANITGNNILTGGLVSATGNVSGNYILGNGALLTGVITSVANINNGTSNVTVVSSGGNITVGVNGVSNVAVFADTGEYITGVVSASGNVTGNYILGNGSQLTGILGSNVNMGSNTSGQLASNAVTLTTGTTVTNGIALLNQVLGKLVPPAPPNFPNSTAITLTGISTYRMANITQVDNTPGANKAVVAGTTVANVLRVATYATNTISTVGPGDAGTITVVRNGTNAGNVTLNAGASPSGNGTYGSNLVISNNYDYHTANASIAAGFWYVFSAAVSGGTAPGGWNELYIADSSTANTNTTVWYYDSSSPSTPSFSSASMTPLGSANLLYSSTIPHYTNNNNFTIAFTVANVSGNTYPTANTLASGSSGGAFAAPASINYNASNIGSNVLNSFASANANTTVSITTGFGGSATGPSMSVNNSYATGTLTLTTALGNTVLYKSGTATAIDESNVIINTTVGTGSGNAYRILNPGTGNTPVYTGSEAAFNSQSSTLQTYDATVVGSGTAGVLKHDQTNYSTSYLPAGPNLSSGRTGTQYFTMKFVRTAVSKFDIKYTGNIAGMWVALPGSVIDSSSSANGWINMAVAYGGAGYPGVNSPGNGSDGCATGGIVTLNTSVTNSSKTCTFGTVSSSSTATNEIYVRIALTAGQSVTALTLETASN